MKNEVVEALTRELDAAGLDYRHEVGKKHSRVVVLPGDDREFFIACASSPSDWRAPIKAVSDLRRELRERGLVHAGEPVVARDNIVSISSGRGITDSRWISERFSKQHKDVLRSIDAVRASLDEDFDRRNFAPISYLDERGRTYRAVEMTRDGFSLVAMGFTGDAALQWKVKFIEAFNALEAELSSLKRDDSKALLARLSYAEGEIQALTDIVLSEKPAGRHRGEIPAATLRRMQVRRERRRAAA